jgi:hypothetical protein
VPPPPQGHTEKAATAATERELSPPLKRLKIGGGGSGGEKEDGEQADRERALLATILTAGVILFLFLMVYFVPRAIKK